MQKKIRSIFLVFLITEIFFSATKIHAQILPSYGNSRTGGSGMQFLKNHFDARSTGMSGAVVGLINDASALYWNPAGITKVDTAKVHVMISRVSYFANINSNFAAIVFKPGKLSYVGISVISMNYGDNDETTEYQPNGTGRKLILGNTLFGLSYAKILTNNFSFGLSAKWANEVLTNVVTNNFLFDIGLTYDVGINYSRFGVSFSNFGLNVSPEGEVKILNLYKEQNVNTFQEISAPGFFRLGFAFDPFHQKDNILTLAGQLNHPTDNNETLAIGAEYSWRKTFYGRSGWEFGSDEPSAFPSVGVGFKLLRNFGGISVDYSLVNKTRLGNVNRLTLSFLIK